MAHSVSAKKRIRQNLSHNLRNKAARSAFRTEMKRVLTCAAEGKTADAQALLPYAMKRIDKAARTSAIHANAAARYKSRLHRAIARSLAGPAVVAAPAKRAKAPAKAATEAKAPSKPAAAKPASPKKSAPKGGASS